MDAPRLASLRFFVDKQVRRDGCDHNHRFTQEWAARESVVWDDLLDLLEANGCFCDCEVVLNLRDEMELRAPKTPAASSGANPWLLPPGFQCTSSATFSKVIVCQAGLARNTHALDGEILIPAPKGVEPRRRVRKSVHFFVGARSGLPSEVGIVQERAEVSALDFAREVAGSPVQELTGFTFREAAFVLSKVAALKPSTTVGTNFTERVQIASRHFELTIHRVIVRG